MASTLFFSAPARTSSYFTGVRWSPSERMVGAILPADGALEYLAPAFEEGSIRDFSCGCGNGGVTIAEHLGVAGGGCGAGDCQRAAVRLAVRFDPGGSEPPGRSGAGSYWG